MHTLHTYAQKVVIMKLLRTFLALCLLAAQITLSQPEGEMGEDDVEEEVWESSPVRNIDDYTPRFVVKLSDGNLFCFAIEGYELFTYNLLTCSYISVNTFLNVSQYEDGSWGRGHTDIGFMIKALDSRVKTGKRLFKAVVDGRNKKAMMENFGEVDMKKGSVTFSVNQVRDYQRYLASFSGSPQKQESLKMRLCDALI